MRKTMILGILACLMAACGEKTPQFTISGEISGDTDKTLYLEEVGTAKIVALDSTDLQSGQFRFKQPRPATPGFYRLRLGNQVINLAIDSTETITVKAGVEDFAIAYTLEGDALHSQKIKELTFLQMATAKKYNDLQKQYEAGALSIDPYVQQANEAVNQYKTAAREYIVADFRALPAYFALFQQINHLLIFDIYDKDDNKLFGAVANGWNQAYPESPRAIQLKNIYAASRAAIRGEQAIEWKETDSRTLFDISLPTLDGKEIRLSEIAVGKTVLIDFTAYSGAGSPAHNLQLAGIYSQYHPQGLEIYQVALDTDSHLWKNAAVNLPWICVLDPQSVYSPITLTYNVRNLPASFVMDGEGNIVARIEDYSTLNATVAKYLKK